MDRGLGKCLSHNGRLIELDSEAKVDKRVDES
jgi:hypothetical protein